MALDLPHEIRDPIHGLIRLTSQEMQLVNTPNFQRLRRIRQLAMADLVYPGALHTRFEHSLGTLHVAQRILGHLKQTQKVPEPDERVVRLAALLHDIGHGPFSHVSEYLLDQHYDRSKVGQASIKEKIHEKVTVDIINKSESISSLLSENDRKEIANIIAGGRTRDYRRDIVSSSLDADKMDYLLRDAHFVGVKYGQFDLDKVIDVCGKFERGSESYLVIHEEGLFAVEQLVLAKHHMTQQVYAHRVRTITDLMIVRGLQLAIADGFTEVKALFSYDGSKDFLTHYLEYDDGTLTALLVNGSYPRPKSLFQRLRKRDLFKEVALIPLDELRVVDSITRGQLLNIDNSAITELEQRIATLMHCEPWEVIVHKKSIRHPAYQERVGLEPEAIHVMSRDGPVRMMSEFPDLVSPKMPKTERLHVIAPFPFNGTTSREERKKAAAHLEQQIRELVFNYIGGVP